MKTCLLWIAFLTLPLGALATEGAHDNSIRILEVGLKGYYSTLAPTPVRVQVTGPADGGRVDLQFALAGGERESFGPLRTDYFSKQLSLKPSETAEMEVPILFYGAGPARLELTARDGAGQRIGSSVVDVASSDGGQRVVAILCKEERWCEEAQAQISFGGSEDQNSEKSKQLRFVTLSTAREQWWSYSPAAFLVVAEPIRDWTADQKSALECYLRAGGTLLLLEKEANDPSFLAAYRGKGGPAALVVGLGRLYRIKELPSQGLNSLFSGDLYRKTVENSSELASQFNSYRAEPALLRQVGVSFDFPRLHWVLLWLAVYIVVSGVLNFTLLRRWRRLEWGWVTTTCIAILFACGLYLASSMRRPKHITLDNVVTYHMDSRSPVAVEKIDLRVSSPERLTTTITVGDAASLELGNPAPGNNQSAEIATDITEGRRRLEGWRMGLGPPQEIALSLLRWSYSDLHLRTIRVLDGSVTLDQRLHLKNDTGQTFAAAVYLDFDSNNKYRISDFASGHDIDLTTLPSSQIIRTVRSGDDEERVQDAIFDGSSPQSGPAHALGKMSPAELPLGPGRHFFVGISDGPVPEANLAGLEFVRHNLAVTIVNLDQP